MKAEKKSVLSLAVLNGFWALTLSVGLLPARAEEPSAEKIKAGGESGWAKLFRPPEKSGISLVMGVGATALSGHGNDGCFLTWASKALLTRSGPKSWPMSI